MSLRPLIDRLSDLDLDPPSSLPDGLLLSRSREPRGFDAVLYEPLVCLILPTASAPGSASWSATPCP